MNVRAEALPTTADPMSLDDRRPFDARRLSPRLDRRPFALP